MIKVHEEAVFHKSECVLKKKFKKKWSKDYSCPKKTKKKNSLILVKTTPLLFYIILFTFCIYML